MLAQSIGFSFIKRGIFYNTLLYMLFSERLRTGHNLKDNNRFRSHSGNIQINLPYLLFITPCFNTLIFASPVLLLIFQHTHPCKSIYLTEISQYLAHLCHRDFYIISSGIDRLKKIHKFKRKFKAGDGVNSFNLNLIIFYVRGTLRFT